MIDYLTAAIGVFGVIAGATLQFLFTRLVEQKRHLRELRTSAYVDYLESVARAGNSQVLFDVEQAGEVFTRLADAKSRICVYGSRSVVRALYRFEESGASTSSEEGIKNFASLVSNMRRNSAGRLSGVPPKHLTGILFSEFGSIATMKKFNNDAK